MKIEEIDPKAYERSINPGIIFKVSISFTTYQEAITNVRGWLETDDQKILAEINEEVTESEDADNIGARGSAIDSQFKLGHKEKSLVAFLDKRALTHIETRRMQNKKGSVKLTLDLRVKSIVTSAVICPVYGVSPSALGITPIEIATGHGKSNGWIALAYASGPDYSSADGNRWILSGSGSPLFLTISEQNLKGHVEITIADWLQDFAPKLGLGEYFIVEIPAGEKTIKKAWDYLEQAEECYRHWDVDGAFAKCRDAGRSLDTKMKEELGKDSFGYKERWGRSYLRFNTVSFSHVASLGLHREELGKKYPSGEVRIGKADTEHLLIITKALVKLAEEILNE